MQPDFPIRQDFRPGGTNAGHDCIQMIHLVVPHVNLSVFRNNSQEMSIPDFSTGILTGEDIAGLLIMKQRFSRYFPIICIADGFEYSVVVVHDAGQVNERPGVFVIIKFAVWEDFRVNLVFSAATFLSAEVFTLNHHESSRIAGRQFPGKWVLAGRSERGGRCRE